VPAFRLRFGAAAVDLVLEDRLGEATVRAVAALLSLGRAVLETIPAHELDHLPGGRARSWAWV
jgi:hypothetical protein